MDLILFRHAHAEELADYLRSGGTSDEGRPLTEEGVSKMSKAVQGLKTLVTSLQVVAASPLVRAQQTAELIAEGFTPAELVTLPALAPGGHVDDVVDWLSRQEVDAVLALVGHEPSISALASWLLCPKSQPFLVFKKGMGCMLSFPAAVAPGQAELKWLLPSKVLRKLV